MMKNNLMSRILVALLAIALVGGFAVAQSTSSSKAGTKKPSTTKIAKQAPADNTLVMKDGSRVTGTLVSATAHNISFKDAHGVLHRYNTSQIAALEFSTAQTTSSVPSSAPRKLEVVPAGTELAVRTNEAIDSNVAKENQTFSGQFEQDILGASGEVIVPKGSLAELVIRKISAGGMTGSPEMVLDVQAITVAGRRYVVSTTDLQEKSDTGIGMNKRTAEMVGGGAVLGTILGAVAGGGKGAAIGALAGTAGGAGAQVLLKGKHVLVPAETILKFRLDQAVSLQATG
jgi:hypothetical protein